MTKQLAGIMRKIRAVDSVMTPGLQQRVREGHPEVTFAVLSAQGCGLRSRKKSVAGRSQRLSILQNWIPTQVNLPAERKRLGIHRVALDDLVDALACLVTAQRWSKSTAITFPSDALCQDSRGLRMEMVA